MKIINIQTQVKNILLKTPFITALRRVESVEYVRVKVVCDNGYVGIGEAPATKAITGEDIEIILNSISSVKNFFTDKSPQEALKILHDTGCNIGSSAKAALDIAFVSLMAQGKNQKLYEYLGAKEIVPLQTDVTISFKHPSEMLEDAKEALQNSMWILKVKLGSDIDHAIDATYTISKELPKAKILIDANQAWSLEDSLKYVEAMMDVDIELIEQPVVADDLDGLKQITNISHIPILADEAVFTLEDAKKIISTKSADMINIKLMKCGGLTKAVEILELCRGHDIKCMLGSMLEGPYSINAALHLALAYRDVIKYIDLDSPLLYKEPSDELEFSFNGCEVLLKK